MTPLVAVASDRYARSNRAALWNHNGSLGYEVVPLDSALSKRYDSDAHFTCGVIYRDGKPLKWQPRLSKTPERNETTWIDPLVDLQAHGYEVRFTVVAVDLDMPRHQPLDALHCQDIAHRYNKLTTWDLYTTRGGMRAVRRLLSPLTPDEYEQYVRICITELRMVLAGTTWVIDQSCADWTRHFRCPYVMRDGKPTTPTVKIVNKPVNKPYLAARPSRPITAPGVGQEGRAVTNLTIGKAVEAVRTAPLGTRHTTLYCAAATLAETTMSEREIFDALLPVAIEVAEEREAARGKKERCIADGIRRGRSNRPIVVEGPGMCIEEV